MPWIPTFYILEGRLCPGKPLLTTVGARPNMESISETDSRHKPLIDRGYWAEYGENFSRNSEMIPSKYGITEKYIYILNSSEGVGVPSVPRPRSCGRDPNSGLPQILCFIRNVLPPSSLFQISIFRYSKRILFPIQRFIVS